MKRINKLIIIVCITLSIICFSMYFILSSNKKNENEEMVGDISFTYVDKSVYIKDAIPTLDKFGVMNEGFTFTIKNNSIKASKYTLSLIDIESTIKNSDIRYELTKNGDVLTIATLPSDGILDISEIHGNEEINYTIKLWLDYNSDYINGSFSKKISISVGSNENVIVNEPELIDGMIPVYYDYDNNSWHKADITKNNWYKYEDKKWANAVTVNANKREFYLKSEVDTKILIEDINSFWVWIPRFNYSLSNSDININFVKNNEEAYKAFTFDENELSGFWVAKFEAGMKDESCVKNNSCNNSNNKLYFVPNYHFLNRMSLANMFYAIRKMELNNNIYGFPSGGNKFNVDGTIINDNNNFDTHLIKNSEWQAVSLLSDSKYGINKKITNNNSNYTGKATYDDISYDYNVLSKGEEASTTGNVYGIYDMAGGMREYTMITNASLNLFSSKSNSGFSVIIKDYYYDHNFNDDTTLQFQDRYSEENNITNNPITRGGYKNTGNIFNVYSADDYNNKVSKESSARASMIIMKENKND